ncbi:MAG: cytochrome C [Sulfurospirillaceae bacterium]|nr:cytochrome C [Sulfurospirillaceae bacterium]MDD2825662.1 cytochrome C [Sulfurospirillaceae bacterium]
MKKIILGTMVVASLAFSGSVPVVADALYQKECASCHFGYQPALLNKASWEKVMGSLSDHFGTDASLNKEDHQAILSYLVRNAGNGKITTNNDTTRITQSAYFKKEHRKIPLNVITQKEVGSLANCMACHTTADKGSYSERDIVVPNYGRWE